MVFGFVFRVLQALKEKGAQAQQTVFTRLRAREQKALFKKNV